MALPFVLEQCVFAHIVHIVHTDFVHVCLWLRVDYQ